MQALTAAISSSCGLAAPSLPSSSQGSSATILWLRATRSPAMVKPSTVVSLRVWPCHRVVTSKVTLALPASSWIASTTSPRALRSRPLTRLFTVSSMISSPCRVGSTENRRGFGDALRGARREALEGRLEALVDHAGTDVGPARGLVLLLEHRLAILDLAADGVLERVEVEAGLHLQAAVEEGADLEKLVDRLVDLRFGTAFGERVDDQSIELRVLRFFLPVVQHQALEERIEVRVVADRAQVMRLGHPLDHQDHEADRERIVA